MGGCDNCSAEITNEISWKYVKPLQSCNLVDEFERVVGYTFPDLFTECVRKHNNGRPTPNVFTPQGNTVKKLLSFNKDDKETVWQIWKWNKTELQGEYIPFAIDNFGNLLCFAKTDNRILFITLEDVVVHPVANSFVDFLNLLCDR